MNIHIAARADIARDDKTIESDAKPAVVRASRKPNANRAPKRPLATHQIQQGATMAYQQGFTSGPLS